MSHPYYHAKSSLDRFNFGDLDYFIKIHEWFDTTKSTYPSTEHRMILHHEYGIDIAKYAFNEYPDRVVIDVGRQHIKEDYGDKVPFFSDICKCFNTTGFGFEPTIDVMAMSDLMRKRFRGIKEDYIAFNELMDKYHLYTENPNGRFVTHSSFGCFLMRDMIGHTYTIKSTGRVIPTRYIAEFHIKAEFSGMIPTPQDWAKLINQRKWNSLIGTPEKLSKRYYRNGI